MACTPLSIDVGLFINDATTAWSNAPSTSRGGKTVTRTSSGITVSGPTGSVFHSTPGSRTSSYLMFGSQNFVLILDSDTGVAPVTRSVTLIDFTTTPPTERFLFSVLATSSAVDTPNVNFSRGTGSAFLIWGPTGMIGAEAANLAIHRSDTGAVICPGPPPFTPSLPLGGEATATDVILYHPGVGTGSTTCPLPRGQLSVSPASQSFGTAVVGGPPASASTMRNFTLRNNGSDCLTINNIADATPFSLAPASRAILPITLNPAQTRDVTVIFAPTAVGSTGNINMAVTRTPANGDDKLTCSGTGRNPTTAISFNATTHNFGKVPVGSSASFNLVISNSGETALNVNLAGSLIGQAISWGPFGGSIAVGGPAVTIPVNFQPGVEGPVSTTITVTSNAPGSPHTIQFLGEGCIPNATFITPPTPFPSFGQIQQGFRTVRFITIQNSGDGPLNFTASISGADSVLYGLQLDSGSVTDVRPSRNYTVNPPSACGAIPTGSGSMVIAVAFFANQAPGPTSAVLTIDNHNDPNTTQASFTYNMAAEIVAPEAVDAALVLDRSGSMSQMIGTRNKTEAAIAGGRLFVQLLRADLDDRTAVVRYNQLPDVVQAMVPVSSSTPPTQGDIVNQINSTNFAPGGNTCIAGGIITAENELSTPRATTPPVLHKAIVVLTDGIDNTGFLDPADGQWYSLRGGDKFHPTNSSIVSTLPLPAPPSGVKIYAIGLGRRENISADDLATLATTTNGYYQGVEDLVGPAYFTLEKHFTQIFMEATGTTPISDPLYTIVPGDEHRIEFDVLRGDVSALVVVYDYEGKRLPFFLVSPQGEIFNSNVIPPGYQMRFNSAPTSRFVEVRMPLLEPDRYAGRWTVVVRHPGIICEGPVEKDEDIRKGFLPRKCKEYQEPLDYGIAIGVGSNFRMQPFVTPGRVRVGDPILLSAIITEAGLAVTGCRVSVRASSPGGLVYHLSLYDDGGHNDGDLDDGEYAKFFTQTTEGGVYQFTFRAEGISRDGEPVTREAVRSKYVEGRVPTGGGEQDDCCEKLTEAINRQTNLIEALLRSIPGGER